MTNDVSGHDHLDETDRALLRELDVAPRSTAAALARTLGISRHAAQARLTRLLEDKVVHVTALIEPARLGWPVLASLHVVVSRGRREFAASLSKNPQVTRVVLLRDAAGLLVTIAAPDLSSLTEIVDATVRSWDGYVSSTVAVMTGQAVRAGDSVQFNRVDHDHAAPLDAVDEQVVDALRNDGRTSFAELAKLTGLSVVSARQRFLRLTQNGTITVRAITPTEILGLPVRAMISLRSNGPSSELAEALSLKPHMQWVTQVLGDADAHVEVVRRDRDELLEAVDEIASMPQVSSWHLHEFDEATHFVRLWS